MSKTRTRNCEIAHEPNIGMLIATHDPVMVNSADRVLHIQDGLVTEMPKSMG